MYYVGSVAAEKVYQIVKSSVCETAMKQVNRQTVVSVIKICQQLETFILLKLSKKSKYCRSFKRLSVAVALLIVFSPLPANLQLFAYGSANRYSAAI